MSSGPLLRALALDDEPYILSTFRRVFRRDLELVTETDQQRGLEQLEAHDVDVIFVDYAMPKMSGVEFLERARRLRPHAICFLVTAHATSPDVEDAVRRGLATAVIGKPWSRDEILAKLAMVPRR